MADTACTGGLRDSGMILKALLMSGLFLTAGTFWPFLSAAMHSWTWPLVRVSALPLQAGSGCNWTTAAVPGTRLLMLVWFTSQHLPHVTQH